MKIILKDTLDILGKSQYWLSKETGITFPTINNLCKNKTTKIDFTTLEKICKALNCEITDVITLDDSNQK